MRARSALASCPAHSLDTFTNNGHAWNTHLFASIGCSLLIGAAVESFVAAVEKLPLPYVCVCILYDTRKKAI